MVAPVAAAAGKKAAGNPGGILLIAGLAALVLLRGVRALPELPDVTPVLDTAKKPAEWVADEWDKIWNPPSGQFSWRDPLAELRQEARTVKRYTDTSKAFLGGIVQGDNDFYMHDEEYYQSVHYDDRGIPIAVPVETDRIARQFGDRIRGWFTFD